MNKKSLAIILISGGLIILSITLYGYNESKKQQAANESLQNLISSNAAKTQQDTSYSLQVPVTCADVTVGDLHAMCDEEVLSIASPAAQTCFIDLYAEIWPQGASGDDWVVLEACRVASHTYMNGAQESESLSAYIDTHFTEKYKGVRPKQ